jgi:predicted transcriptional regulator
MPKPSNISDKNASQLSFIHSTLDDRTDLSPFDIRVYIRALRRAGRDGVLNESVPNIAKRINMHEATVRASLQTLCALNILLPTYRTGQTTIYSPVEPEHWHHPTQTAGVVKPEGGGPLKPQGTSKVKPQGHPCGLTAPKVYPSEVTPSEVPPMKGGAAPLVSGKMFAGEITREIKDLKDEIKRTRYKLEGMELCKEDKDELIVMYQKLRALEEKKFGVPRTPVLGALLKDRDPNDRNANTANAGRASDYAGVGRPPTGAEQRQVGIGEVAPFDYEKLDRIQAADWENRPTPKPTPSSEPVTSPGMSAEMFAALRKEVGLAPTPQPRRAARINDHADELAPAKKPRVLNVKTE